MRRATLLRALALAAIFVGLPIYWTIFPPKLPIGTANGVFVSDCCGSLSLRDGVLTTGDGQATAYVVEYDKVGRFVLTERYVGMSDQGFIFDRDKAPLKLRLWGEPRPDGIEVTDDATGKTVVFNRR